MLVLASGSRWRRQLLADVGVPVVSVAPPVDEETILDPDPVALALARARAKAAAVRAAHPGAWVIGADQVATLDGEAFGKPLDPVDHRRRLGQLRGRTHRLTTGVVLLGADVDRAFVEHTDITFRADLSDAELDAYVASGEGAGSAGGYEAEHRGAQLIARIDGDWFNVLGLPVLRLVDELRRLGWRPTFPDRP